MKYGNKEIINYVCLEVFGKKKPTFRPGFSKIYGEAIKRKLATQKCLENINSNEKLERIDVAGEGNW